MFLGSFTPLSTLCKFIIHCHIEHVIINSFSLPFLAAINYIFHFCFVIFKGALLGAGASIMGLGSDLMGSIRIPAAFNGVFGHKPSGGKKF